MSIDKPANERLNLYNRFKETLRSADDSTFFDADDLIVIFDQAVDLDDEYTEIEVVMRGFRYFPDNEELAARRAFLYYNLNLDEGVDNIRTQLPADSPMSRILAIRRLDDDARSRRDEILPLLDEIVSAPGLLNDEEIIQFVDCAGAANCFDWLKENEKRLRAKTDYLPTLLYELFITADINGDRAYSLALLEELTELQPFNIDFWNALAQVQSVSDDPLTPPDLDAALSSLEFALAIEGENPEALTLKASILLQQGNEAEAEKTLRHLADKFASPTAAEIYVRTLLALGLTDDATMRLVSYCRQFTNSRELLDLALEIDREELDAIVIDHLAGSETEEIAEWRKWAEILYRDDKLPKAVKLLDIMHGSHTLDNDGYKLLFSGLYCLGKYDRCIELFGELEAKVPDMLLAEMVVATMMSYVRKGDKAEAQDAFRQICARFPMRLSDSWTLATSLESIGMSHFMTALKTTIEGRGKMNADDIDIFEFPYLNQNTTEE